MPAIGHHLVEVTVVNETGNEGTRGIRTDHKCFSTSGALIRDST
jgi:hypothetical protein